MFKWKLFVQFGNSKQSDNNGMLRYTTYSFGASTGENQDFCILDQHEGGVSGPWWSMSPKYCTTFRLEFIY